MDREKVVRENKVGGDMSRPFILGPSSQDYLREFYSDVEIFSRGLWSRYPLRPYQIEPARRLAEAVHKTQAGLSNIKKSPATNQYAIVFSRQAGKDEMTAQLVAYLLNRYQNYGGQIIVAAPTDRQASISRDRLLARLDNPLNRQQVKSRDGYIVQLGQASARYLSAAPTANVRGETASLLLIANEAQDIQPERWDAVFDPMAASTNAPTVFMGTVWSSTTLLARQMRQLEQHDGQRRVFLVDWQTVAQHVPAYGQRVQARIAQFGPTHPFIQTEYFLKELDGNGGLFGPDRRALMVGSHPRQLHAQNGNLYALLIDLAGEGQPTHQPNPRQDSTAVTVVQIKPPLPHHPQPSYRVVQRYVWQGVKHTDLYPRLVGLARDTWQARYVVVDATGLGATLAAFLSGALGEKRVLPFVFSAKSKSDLGWNFCGLIDSGRFKDYAPDGAPDTDWWWRQLAAVEYEIRPGPGQLMRWSVPDPTLHDDLVMSAALVALLDQQDWQPRQAHALPDRAGW